MKKLIVLLIPVLLMFSSCDNKSKGETETKKETTATPVDTAKTVDNSVTGTGSTPAQVFLAGVGTPISGATVIANLAGKQIDKSTSDSKGMYSFTLLTKDKTYTYISTATGFKPDTMTAPYDGTTNSLPAMGMKAQ